jgi:chromosome transmission fidelity protein 4
LLILWDTSSSEVSPNSPPTILHTIDGIIPKVVDTDSVEFLHDCSAVWHPSGSSFFVASRTHDVVQVSKDGWNRTATFTDEQATGAYTALAISPNGVYVAAASRAGICVWSCQSRRTLFRFPANLAVPVLQLSFCPTKNILAWVDAEGVFSRVPDTIPTSSPDPVKPPACANSLLCFYKALTDERSVLFSVRGVANNSALQTTRPKADVLGLFDDEPASVSSPSKNIGPNDVDGVQDTDMVDLDDDNWILDDLGGGAYKDSKADDETEKKWAKAGVREMGRQHRCAQQG